MIPANTFAQQLVHRLRKNPKFYYTLTASLDPPRCPLVQDSATMMTNLCAITKTAFHPTIAATETTTALIIRMKPIAKMKPSLANQMNSNVQLTINVFLKSGFATEMTIAEEMDQTKLDVMQNHRGLPVGLMNFSVGREASAFHLVTSVMENEIVSTAQMNLDAAVQLL